MVVINVTNDTSPSVVSLSKLLELLLSIGEEDPDVEVGVNDTDVEATCVAIKEILPDCTIRVKRWSICRGSVAKQLVV